MDAVGNELNTSGVLSWDEIKSYCRQTFDDEWVGMHYLADSLFYLFKPKVGILIEKVDIDDEHRRLNFDKSGLLTSGQDGVEFVKEGVLFDQHFIRYAAELRRYPFSASGGLLDNLLARLNYGEVAKFGLAIERDIIFPRSLYKRTMTEARIRGPIGLSLAQLSSPLFPENRKGTVTVHRRTDERPLDEAV